jgi:hypothetical protein|tara:strand:- start:2218 stop:2718 length:501 start_codon:yes stop_codon:yes gene_type:complete
MHDLADFDCAFPARPELLVQLQKPAGPVDCCLATVHVIDRVAAHPFLGFSKWPVDHNNRVVSQSDGGAVLYGEQAALFQQCAPVSGLKRADAFCGSYCLDERALRLSRRPTVVWKENPVQRGKWLSKRPSQRGGWHLEGWQLRPDKKKGRLAAPLPKFCTVSAYAE